MYEGIDTIVLDAELAYQDIVPLTWLPLATSCANESSQQFTDRNVRLLQACAALDEHGQLEKADENSAHAADILRLDMKVNLLLDLVGSILVANRPRPTPVRVRFNAHGATWKIIATAQSLPVTGDVGVLEIYLKDCLAEPLRLFGRIASVSAGGQINVKFDHLGKAVAELIEKLAFTRHRRQVADARQARGVSAVPHDKNRR
jgi:Atypical PilZ domain, cyclic di-GMP receptor